MEKESILKKRHLYASSDFRETKYNATFKLSNLIL